MKEFYFRNARGGSRILRFLSPYLRKRADWSRIQASRVVIVLCALAVALSNLTSKYSYNFLGLGDSYGESVVLSESFYEPSQVFHSLALAPVADASQAISPEEMERLKKEGEKATVANQALVGITNPTPEEFVDSGQDVYLYVVQEGDTLGSIAEKYKITSNTIRWANGLENADMIHPGDQLFVLPVTGVKYKVKSGDNIEAVAKKYDAKVDEIIAFNELPANGALKEGDEIIIPDGKVDEPQASRNLATGTGTRGTSVSGTAPVASSTDRKFNKQYYSSSAHRFPWGWCTWYVASKRHVPWGGNAGTWLYHAKAYGANIGRAPRPGAIMVTGESGYGHVGIVESVKGDSFTVSEMNYKGFGVVSRRTISAKAGMIKGFIY